jgi:predicted nucleic acid-binding Zn ribbon protein
MNGSKAVCKGMKKPTRTYTLRFKSCVACGTPFTAIRYDALLCSSTCKLRLFRAKVKAIDAYRQQLIAWRGELKRDLLIDRYGPLIARILILVLVLTQSKGEA